jgi:two-component system KDP operon response regulator KdpE
VNALILFFRVGGTTMTTERTTENPPRILIIDDELAIRRFLRTVLSGEEFVLHEAENGHAGLAAAAMFRPDVILLDLGLPDLDGIEVINRIRDWSQVPIIVLSVRDREDDKIDALDAGADDYLTKPFGVGELLARIRASLRRSLQEIPEPVFISNDLMVDLGSRQVSVNGKDISLTPTEFDILRLLVAHAGKVLTHRQILKQLWGIAYLEQPHVLRVNISNLRRKLESDPSRPRHIITEPGIGYRLKLPS